MIRHTDHTDVAHWDDCFTPPPGLVGDDGLFPCGCGSRHAWAPAARIIHWPVEGQPSDHWYLVCAFRHSLFLISNS